jgi:hypothetical protein
MGKRPNAKVNPRVCVSNDNQITRNGSPHTRRVEPLVRRIVSRCQSAKKSFTQSLLWLYEGRRPTANAIPIAVLIRPKIQIG